MGVQEALAAVGQNNSTNLTSKAPTDVVTVIKQGEQSVSGQLDQAREAMQSDNTSQAIQYIEQAQAAVRNTSDLCDFSAKHYCRHQINLLNQSEYLILIYCNCFG